MNRSCEWLKTFLVLFARFGDKNRILVWRGNGSPQHIPFVAALTSDFDYALINFTGMTITLLSTFLIAAGVSNAIAAEYVFLEFYTSAGCNEADAAGTVKAYAIGMCFDKQKMSAGLNGNFTLTQFEDDDCKTEAKVNPLC